jgi:hypothetical protein
MDPDMQNSGFWSGTFNKRNQNVTIGIPNSNRFIVTVLLILPSREWSRGVGAVGAWRYFEHVGL